MSSQQITQSRQAQPDRRNACPGLSRMVMARDGAIARIKLRLGRLSADQARSIAAIAERFDAGAIELSIRSNIQLRGITPRHWNDAVAALHEAGLGADNPGADDIRNVMVSPTAGIDRGQICDVTGLASSVLDMLQANEAFYALSPKFSLQIDGGENCAMISHPGDIWLSAIDGETFAFGLASSPDREALGAVDAQHALPFIETMLRRFLRHASFARMKHLFEAIPASEFVAGLSRELSFPIHPATGWKRKAPMPFSHLGNNQQSDGSFYVGAVPLLGRLTSAQLAGLADLSDSGRRGLRLTPWQGVILPYAGETQIGELTEKLRSLDLETTAEAPHARLRACSGSNGCVSALADTQTDGKRLATYLAPGKSSVHITGCAKSCAALAPLPHTLLARSTGRYDLYAQETFPQDGAGPSRFGRLLATDITIDEAACLLNARH
ncbi:precorrin-3B synthase [Brucella anthropi]|uniref:Precorrin-3B synthase n=1 Tax=Brucella anthropi TaxID=529 RepID=A0A011UQ37_BRUAN|nr:MULTISPECIES: precorrin-3B synthase [Brucella/Ochrobactrum group]MCR5942984.1 precorrin-3B synthase [Ochrobactrum sp. XJ1]QTN02980.1 precorrin-3B synthase [Ochrobactrum sp. EEELCW01]EXL07998.1 precorrin-3B synthase [Brucella anthropi]KAB2737944.1 precorrin-3B synthase [Brucella anthropi]KAB2760391.1 precorrin-3B synthase [Brucella anthropi]